MEGGQRLADPPAVGQQLLQLAVDAPLSGQGLVEKAVHVIDIGELGHLAQVGRGGRGPGLGRPALQRAGRGHAGTARAAPEWGNGGPAPGAGRWARSELRSPALRLVCKCNKVMK